MAGKPRKTEAINPLTNEHYDMIQREIEQVPRIIETINKAEECGINCHIQRDQLEQLVASLTRIRDTFFPAGRIK